MITLLAAVLAASATAAAPAPASRQPAPSDTPASPERRYCVESVRTGSRIMYRECHTRAEWLREGFDPLEPD